MSSRASRYELTIVPRLSHRPSRQVRGRDGFHRRVGEVLGSRPRLSADLYAAWSGGASAIRCWCRAAVHRALTKPPKSVGTRNLPAARSHRMPRTRAPRPVKTIRATGTVATARMHPHMLRHTFVTTPASTCATSRSPHATLTRAPPCATTEPATTSIAIRTTSSRRSWRQQPEDRTCRSPCSTPIARGNWPLAASDRWGGSGAGSGLRRGRWGRCLAG